MNTVWEDILYCITGMSLADGPAEAPDMYNGW